MPHKAPTRPLAADTSPEAERILIEHYRSLEPWQRVKIVRELAARDRANASVGIRERHPEADDREIQLRLFAILHGKELALRAFGWNVDVEGW